MKETDHPPGPGWLARWVSAASWLPRYQRRWLAGDAIAGFTIWGLLITLAAGMIVLTGLIFVVAGLLKLGFITAFLSRPVSCPSCSG
jgi:MFS superfamily sulfate permease-like transporter